MSVKEGQRCKFMAKISSSQSYTKSLYLSFEIFKSSLRILDIISFIANVGKLCQKREILNFIRIIFKNNFKLYQDCIRGTEHEEELLNVCDTSHKSNQACSEHPQEKVAKITRKRFSHLYGFSALHIRKVYISRMFIYLSYSLKPKLKEVEGIS